MRRLEWPHGFVVLAAAAAVILAVVAGPARAELPDGRAYELVSPPDPNHNGVFATKVSLDGERVALNYQGGVPGSTSGGFSLFLSDRTPTGWQIRSLLLAREQLFDTNYTLAAATPDLTSFIALATHGTPLPQATIKLVKLFDDGTQELLYEFDPVVNRLFFTAATDDLDHVLASVGEEIESGHVAGTRNVYDFGSGTPVLVSRLPDGSVPACGVPTSGTQTFLTGSSMPSQHWISADGKRAFFNTRGSTCTNPIDLYMRDLDAGTTTLISAPPTSGTNGGAIFLQATPDGSEVFFVTTTKLDVADLNTTRDIYRYTVGVGNTCLTCVVANANVTNPSTTDFPVITEDGARIYFTTTGILTGADTDATKSAYLLEGRTLTYVAPVDTTTPNPLQGGAATADGQVLIFRSRKTQLDAMTGSSNGGFFQYYRYDDGDQSLTCISCPSGGPATRDVLSAMVGFALVSLNPGEVMSQDGDLVVFASSDALVPEDVNGGEDVYQWRDGTVSLITDGLATYTELFGNPVTGNDVAGVSNDGEDVLFTSFSALTPEVSDGDQPESQLYDARIGGGGFPVAPPPPAPCTDDACQGTPSTPPSLSGIGSTADDPGSAPSSDDVTLTVEPITKAQRVAFARTSRLALTAQASAAGEIWATMRARIDGRTRVVGFAVRTVGAAEDATLALRLSRAARRALSDKGRLRVTVTVRFSEALVAKHLVLMLKLPATANGR